MSTREGSQRDQVRAALLAGRSLTPLDALHDFGCFRLGARVWELKHVEGFDIETTTVETPGGAHVASYRLAESDPHYPTPGQQAFGFVTELRQ